MSYLKVLVSPGAKREKVEERGDMLFIAVKEPAKQNLANARIRTLVAARYGVPVARVRILSGHRGRSKMLSIAD